MRRFFTLGVLGGIIITFALLGILSLKINNQQFNFKFNPDSLKITEVKEDEDVCPYKADNNFPSAFVSFLPVQMQSWQESNFYTQNVGKTFDAIKLGAGLYKLDSQSASWRIEKVDVDGDLTDETTLYYGDIAMNHTPHIVYAVKNGIIIFAATGANIDIAHTYNDGFTLSETLDWNIGKYKNTRYQLVDGKFIPIWYQISCSVE